MVSLPGMSSDAVGQSRLATIENLSLQNQKLEASLIETTERSRNFEEEISSLRDMARRHIDCESIREAHSTCDHIIGSLHQQREELEETVAALRNDVHRLATENNQTEEMEVLNGIIANMNQELARFQENEPTLQSNLAEARARANTSSNE